jgi:hypothetical protein
MSSSSNSNASLVPILDGLNYGIWSKAMTAYLMLLGLWSHANGSLSKPEGSDTTHAEWVKDNVKALSNIVLHCNAAIQQEVAALEHADTA